MIKKVQDLTQEEKQRFYQSTARKYEETYHMPWSVIEQRMQKEIDDTFDDSRFMKMDPEFRVDAIYARQEFGKNKPSLVDYMLWAVKFVGQSDYIDIPG